jgi:hypothetical protein
MMQQRGLMAPSTSQACRPKAVARPVSRKAVRVQAVAAPERMDMKGVQRPDPNGRFGK